MKTRTKIITITLILITILFTTLSFTFAEYKPTDFNTAINTGGDGANKVKDLGGDIVGIIQIVGTIASVAAIMILGIKYMMGSAEERAEYKKTMLPYFIGAVLIFGASNLAQIVYKWASGI